MPLRKSASLRTYPLVACLSLAVVPTVALANEDPSASASLPEDGAIIYSRDVHHNIGDRYFPRESQSAVTAPARLIVDTIVLGLEPLTDAESSAILAPLTSQGLVDPSTTAATDLINSGAGSGSANLIATTSSASSGVNSAVSGAMGSLAGALDSLSVLAGGGQ